MFRFPFGTVQELNLDWFLEQWEIFKVQAREAFEGIDHALDDEIDRVEDAMSDLYAARDAAIAAKTAAETAESSTLGYAQSAANSAASAAGSAAGSAQSASSSAGSAQQAAQSAQTSAQQASSAATSAGNASTSATNASSSAATAANNATIARDSAQESAAWATGSYTGNPSQYPVPSTAPQHENNAEYYANAASDSATAAAGSATAAAGSATAAAGSASDAADSAASVSASAAQIAQNASDITDLQTDMTAAEGDISTLQNDLNAAEGNISTTQTDLDTAESNITRYNAFDMLPQLGTFTNGSHNGITFSFDGSACTAIGTATNIAFRNVVESLSALPDGLSAGETYHVNFNSTDPTKLKASFLFYKNEVNTSSKTLSENGPAEVSIPADATGIVIRYVVPNGTVISTALTALLNIQNTDSNSQLADKAEALTTDVATLSNLWVAYITPGYENTAKFEKGTDNVVWFSWDSNLLSYTIRSVGWNKATAAASVGDSYSGTSPSGITNAIKIPAGYLFTVVVEDDQVTISIIAISEYDRKKHLALVYNRAGAVVGGEMLKYYTADEKAVCILPAKLRVCGGVEMNVYHQNIIRYDNPARYALIANTNMFSHGQYYSRYAPPVDTLSNFNTVFKFYKNNDVDITFQKTIGVNVIPKTSGNGLTKKVLFIGDSMTANDIYPNRVAALFSDDVMDVEFLGTQDTGSGETPNEGYSGWRAYTFCRCAQGSDDLPGLSGTNPFYNNGHFDFSKYMTDQNYEGVDYVFICLGTNDVATSRASHSTDADIVSYWSEIIESIHDYDENIKIALWMPPVGSQTVNYNRVYLDSAMRMHQIILSNFDNLEESNVFLCPVFMNVDPFHDYPCTLQNVSADNTSFQEYIGSDTIHPANPGYYKIADVIYSMIKYFGSLDET